MNIQANKGHPLQTYYSGIYKTYDLVNRIFTFGLDGRWRRFTVRECLLSKPQRILDLCCGTGDMAILAGKNTPGQKRITGYDLNREMLAIARQKAERQGIAVEFIEGDVINMPFLNEEFDSIMIGFGFRNLTWENPSRDQHLQEISRCMKPGAKFLILESARPKNRMIACFYTLYLKMVLIPVGGILSGDWNAYRYLAGSSAGFYSFDILQQLLEQYQLTLQLRKKFMFGSVNLLIATKSGL